MKDLWSLHLGTSSILFNLNLWRSYYLSSWVFMTLMAIALLTINAYYPQRMVDLWSADYFLRDRWIERYFGTYILSYQLIFHGYILSLFYLFFYEMRRWGWLLPHYPKGYIFLTMLMMILLSAWLMQGWIVLFNARLSEVFPIASTPPPVNIGTYTVCSYLLFWAAFKIKGTIIYGLMVFLALLYPMDGTTTHTIFAWLGLFSEHIAFDTSLIQGLSISIFALVLSGYRLTQKPLFET